MPLTLDQTALIGVWDAIATIAKRDGVPPLNQLPGPYHLRLDPWELWINGTRTDLPKTERLPAIARFEMYVEFNGWPAGLLTPLEGSIAAGEAANIFTLRDALKKEAERA